MDELLRLNLQYFADEKEGNEDPNPSDETLNPDEGETKQGEPGNPIPYDRFKEKVDEVNALKAKLEALEQADTEAKRKELEEQEKYKELYEDALEQLSKASKVAVEKDRESALRQAGYGDEQVELLSKLVEGNTEDEIAESVKKLLDSFPVKKQYVDPSVDQTKRQKPDAVEGEDVGRSLFEKLAGSGRIKGVKK